MNQESIKSDSADPFDDAYHDGAARAERSGLSSGFKAALVAILGCGGCLTLAILAIVTFGFGAYQAITSASPIGLEFIEAVEEGRFDDARRRMSPELRARANLDDELEQLRRSLDDLGPRSKVGTRTASLASDDGSTSFDFGVDVRHRDGTAVWSVEMIEVDDDWLVEDWSVEIVGDVPESDEFDDIPD